MSKIKKFAWQSNKKILKFRIKIQSDTKSKEQ